MAETKPHEISLDMNELYSFITAVTNRNPGISSCTWGTAASDCLPIYIKMQRPSPVNSPQFGNTFVSSNFQAILGLFLNLPPSPPPLSELIGTVMLTAFVFSFCGVLLQKPFPKIAHLLQMFGALLAAIGVCIMGSPLLHPNLTWIRWLACGLILPAFITSFK
ncbi:putative Ileal sodium/bile acid cotransporter [Cucumis melo var. makuwa]|uniref:Ileal sodium/bile acid cotransporter n=2 Tax=Cucumis melo TaxID=3656 RepID=A0A5D3BEH8_CUCMM|nr:putative Ileal sodium/bile acid cotransporter [Cucumis melo var. makuwa]TYJ98162.1 putative Ileal sodium/bile acid cotransporter [Cucumis melo var. makuwa]